MIAKLAIKNILHRPLSALLSWVLLTASVAIISLLVLLQGQFQQKFESNIGGIDLVMGAKGSPLQLILSSVFHLDNPTGNIDYAEAQKWMNNPLVQSAIPLAYGDTYRGFPIVGTTPAYLEKYAASVVQGRVFQQNFEVVIGATIAQKAQLALGSEFFGTHGTAAEGDEHDEHAYHVVGILSPNGTVLDNLILSNLESVWAMHDHGVEHNHEEEHNHDEEEHNHDEEDEYDRHRGDTQGQGKTQNKHEHGHGHRHEEAYADESREPTLHNSTNQPINQSTNPQLTAVLFKFRSPLAIVQWPRLVAQQTDMQLASPAVEVNRIFTLFGIGINALTWLGWAIMGLAALSVFVALFNTLKERRYELALLRTLGGSRAQLSRLMLLESLWMCAAGFLSGMVVSRLALWLVSRAAEKDYRFALDQFGIQWAGEGGLLLLTLGIGLLAALIPALKAYRLDISKTLTHE